MAQPLKESEVFPPMVVQMIGVGEQTGALDAMLSKIADFYEEEVDQAVANLLTLMEPVMIVFLGVTVGGIVISMYLPLFDLISKLSWLGARLSGRRGCRAPTDLPLEHRLKRLMLFRVVMITTLLSSPSTSRRCRRRCAPSTRSTSSSRRPTRSRSARARCCAWVRRPAHQMSTSRSSSTCSSSPASST